MGIFGCKYAGLGLVLDGLDLAACLGIIFNTLQHPMTTPDIQTPAPRVFASGQFMQPSDNDPIRSVVVQTGDAVVVAWLVLPGQRIAAHVHPHGQDTWTVLSGQGAYQTSACGESRLIGAGDVAVAYTGCVHGVHNTGTEPLRFISVVSPAEAGYELLA